MSLLIPKLSKIDALLIFVPLVLATKFLNLALSPVVIFALSIIAILPLAAKMGEATEDLALHYGSHIGGLLNATFGNAAELIIALIAVSKGLTELVKASLTGSIIGNLLFVLGISIVVGGLKYKEQKISNNIAGMNSTMLLIAVISIVIPSIFALIPGHAIADENNLSIVISILLIVLYALSMVFSLKTHSYLFTKKNATHEEPKWTKLHAAIMLITATILLALISEILISQVEQVGHTFGISEIFLGAVIIALVGNAAEHLAAIFFALKNDLDLVVNVTVGSSLQIALFVAPLTVLAGVYLHVPMNLVFTTFEVIALFASAIVVNEIANDGRVNWFEGAQLIILYTIIAALFYFIH